MRILYMGTPEYARSILQNLLQDGENIVGVVTQPDKPVGRKRVMTPPPVKECAIAHGLPVYQPQRLKDGAFAEVLDELKPELILVAAYGKILPRYILDYPRYGCINAHASLLPRHRGAAPIQRAIMAGDTLSGVTSMYMADGIDTGDMILKEVVEITPTDDWGTLHDKLAVAAGVAMRRTLAALRAGDLPREVQDDSLATYAAKIENADCVTDFTHPMAELYNHIRALSPAPLAVALLPDGRTLKLAASALTEEISDAAPGTVIAADKTGIRVVCGDGKILRITEVQPEGKKRMRAADFVNGRALSAGDVLRTPAL